MSEPMSSGEIEDVLSSIRRLVSEDLRPAARGATAHASPPAEASGKLLLTPALRVVQVDAPMAPPEPEVDARADQAGADPSENGAEDPAFHSVRSGPAAEAVAALGAAMGRDAVQDEAGDETETGWSEAPFHHFEEGEDAPRLDTLDPADLWEALPETAATEAIEAEDWVPELDPEPTEAEVFLQADEAEIALDAAPAGGEGASWADAAEAEVLRQLSEEAAADSVFEKMDGPDAVYDEELLRDIVRDIIREELQGALGERITRNVRKLVRAEIARALAVRDFE